VKPGDSVHLEVEASGWRLFDASGDALPAAAAAAPPAPEPLLPPLG
jgi:multiple sugar transport system ATP-binding protein